MIISWNIRGLNNPLKQAEIKSLIANKKIGVMGVLETRVKVDNMQLVWRNLKLANWNLVHNYSYDPLGRIWILYNANFVKLSVLHMSAQFIHCKIEWEGSVFLWTCVYGSYDPSLRKILWNDLHMLSISINIPWLLQGDFNAVMSNFDRMGGNPIDEQAASDFQEWLLKADLQEMRISGPRYTWSNMQAGSKRIYRKLDWCFVNECWCNLWSEALCCILPNSVSDHCPIMIKMERGNVLRKAPFRFYDVWCDLPDFLIIVADVWSKHIYRREVYVQVVSKIEDFEG